MPPSDAVPFAPPAAPATPMTPARGPLWRDQRVRLRTAVPGPKSQELRAREDAHIAPGLQGYAVMSGLAVDSAAGSAVTDVDGNTLLDFIGGIGVGALGHSHPQIVRAVTEQAARVSVGSFTSAARAELVERVAAHAPAPALHRLQLYTSGAEAVESALRLAKSHTGKHEVVGFWGGFHGKTLGAMSLMGSAGKVGFGPTAPGSIQIPYADCYRCPLQARYPSCGLACVELGRKQLRAQSSGRIAAFVVEPMQGTAGNVVPPDDFLPAVQALAREHDALLIADEMITGFGRTGRYWGAGHSGVTADIVTLGKAFGGGFPLSGLLTTDAIARARPWSNPSGSSSSYGGNALGAACGAAALRVIDEEGLVENASRVGSAMLDTLRGFEDDYPFVGHVDGRGLFLRVELVADKATREPLPRAVTERVFRACLERGLLTMAYASSFRLQPALTIDTATADNGLAILREVFDLMKREDWWRPS
jgi:4-aminobutyrate aminotransferase / (S)-3-amino-2-methylpropionate transaminase / 5-aminovalerate transaminase